TRAARRAHRLDGPRSATFMSEGARDSGASHRLCQPAGEAELVSLGVGEHVVRVPLEDGGAELDEALAVAFGVGRVEVDVDTVLRRLWSVHLNELESGD